MSHVGRLLYVAHDRVDIGFATKELCRRMTAPRRVDFEALKRTFRYLSSRKVLVYVYDCKISDLESVTTYVDSDYGGCAESRKSTTGVCVLAGKAPLVVLSRTQSVVALSSAEAEVMAMASGVQELLYWPRQESNRVCTASIPARKQE